MKTTALALLLTLSPAFAAPPKAETVTPLRKAESGLEVTIVPPDGLYEVTVKPKTPAPKGERGIWSIYPRTDVLTVERDAKQWRMKVKPGTYEVGYTTFIKDEQVDSFNTFKIGPAPPPDPPGPGPGPTPPGPVSPSKLWVVFVEETANAVPTRGLMLSDGALSAYMKSKGHQWRVVDKDVRGPDGQPPADVKRFLDAASGKPYPMVFLVDEKGRVRHSWQWTAADSPNSLLMFLKQHDGGN